MKHTDPIQAVLDENKRARQAALQLLYIKSDLDVMHDSDRARTKDDDVQHIMDTYAMSEAEAEHAYAQWLEDVA